MWHLGRPPGGFLRGLLFTDGSTFGAEVPALALPSDALSKLDLLTVAAHEVQWMFYGHMR